MLHKAVCKYIPPPSSPFSDTVKFAMEERTQIQDCPSHSQMASFCWRPALQPLLRDLVDIRPNTKTTTEKLKENDLNERKSSSAQWTDSKLSSASSKNMKPRLKHIPFFKMTSRGCGSFGRVLAKHSECPGFSLQHYIKLAMPKMPALAGGGRRIRSSGSSLAI